MSYPPTCRRVLVTRAAHQAGKLSSALQALGLEPVEVPVLEIRPPADLARLDAAIQRLTSSHEPNPNKKEVVILSDRSEAQGVEGSAVVLPSESVSYDWLILTSANTVRALADRATTLNITLANYSGKVAAVGSATAAAAQQAGFKIDLIPETYVAESLLDKLRSFVSGHDFSHAVSAAKNTGALAPEIIFRGQRILIARASVARDVIPDALRAAGAAVDVVDAYSNAIPASAPQQLREALEQGIAAVTFTSSSSVTHLAAVATQAGITFPFAGVAAISIGPITTQTLIESNWPPAAEATPYDIPGLAAAVANFLV